MTRDDALASVVGWIVREEGGVADVGDGAGLTRWGQTESWLREWVLPIPTTREEAIANYHAWLDKSHIADLVDDDDLLPTVVADFAINSGETPAIEALQASMGITADGVIGPITIHVARACKPRAVGLLILATRQERNGGLITSNPTRYARYARGWAARYGRQMRRLSKGIDGE